MVIPLHSKSHMVALVAVFTALAVVLDSIPIIPGFYSGVWDSWLFLLSPLVGVLLGPSAGAMSVLAGSFIGHLVYFRDPFELVFMMGAPVGAGIAGLVYQRKWKRVLVTYLLLLLAYFISPISWELPLIGVWDTVAGLGLVLIFITHASVNRWSEASNLSTVLYLLFATVIGLESDILVRIFILIPCQTYWIFYGFTVNELQILWLGAGFVTPLKVAMAALVGVSVGFSVLKILGPESVPEPVQNDELSTIA